MLAIHPCSVINSILADQIRLDEIRLRAVGRVVLEPKRLELLRDLAYNIVSFRELAGIEVRRVI
jgi:hypothetical protein